MTTTDFLKYAEDMVGRDYGYVESLRMQFEGIDAAIQRRAMQAGELASQVSQYYTGMSPLISMLTGLRKDRMGGT